METTSAPTLPGWSPEFENLMCALAEEATRQRREDEMRTHIALLNEIYYSVHHPLPVTVIRTDVD